MKKTAKDSSRIGKNGRSPHLTEHLANLLLHQRPLQDLLTKSDGHNGRGKNTKDTERSHKGPKLEIQRS